ncbi:hypothetical protein C8R46DRAFT_1283407 [Mycena filopes]|nr:hypothetical protein C8R46DRAFT_1283407 [Mycena filopes]
MFAPASDLSPNEIRAYRKFVGAFNYIHCKTDGESRHSPKHSANRGTIPSFQSMSLLLYLEHDDSVTPTTLWNPGNAAVKALTGYQSYILADAYLTHPFFSLENFENWVSGVAFQAYMDTIYGKHRGRRNESSPLSSRAPSRAASAAESRPGSRMSFVPLSRASSPMSYPAASDLPSRPSSSMSVDYTVDIQNDESLDVSSPAIPNASDPSLLPTPLEYINALELKITCQHPVDRVMMCTVVPSTFVVPRDSAAYLVDLSDSVDLLTTSTGSGGHAKGDVNVSGFVAEFLTMGDLEMTEYLANLDFGGTTYDLPTLPPPPTLSPALPALLLPAQVAAAEVRPTRKRKAKDPEVDERDIIPGGRSARTRVKSRRAAGDEELADVLPNSLSPFSHPNFSRERSNFSLDTSVPWGARSRQQSVAADRPSHPSSTRVALPSTSVSGRVALPLFWYRLRSGIRGLDSEVLGSCGPDVLTQTPLGKLARFLDETAVTCLYASIVGFARTECKGVCSCASYHAGQGISNAVTARSTRARSTPGLAACAAIFFSSRDSVTYSAAVDPR